MTKSFELSYAQWLESVEREKESFNQFINDLCAEADALGISYDYLRIIDTNAYRIDIMNKVQEAKKETELELAA